MKVPLIYLQRFITTDLTAWERIKKNGIKIPPSRAALTAPTEKTQHDTFRYSGNTAGVVTTSGMTRLKQPILETRENKRNRSLIFQNRLKYSPTWRMTRPNPYNIKDKQIKKATMGKTKANALTVFPTSPVVATPNRNKLRHGYK